MRSISSSKQAVYTTGFPRSGSTWLDRLLSDLLDAPICTLDDSLPTEYKFCKTGRSGYIIIKTHWQVDEWNNSGKVVFIERDPRDVAVSAMFYRDTDLDTAIEGLVSTVPYNDTLHIYHRPGEYEQFVRGWQNRTDSRNVLGIKYRHLHRMPEWNLQRIILLLTKNLLPLKDIKSAYNRQLFTHHAPMYTHSMRKGIVGDWSNYFRRSHGRTLTNHLGQLMIEGKYITDLQWWESLPE